MDYKEEYLKLKRRIIEDDQQKGAGKLDPEFLKELSKLSFVVGDNVLGDDTHAVILSLVDEFNRIAATDLKHNLELSQYYAVGKGLMNKEGSVQCENCEIVLKYVDTTVCITNGRARQHIDKDNNKYYHTNKNGERTEINCDISRGLVRFYIKQKQGNTFKYTRIRVVKTQMVDSLKHYIESLYQNNDEIEKLEDATGIAISKGQSEAILQTAKAGNLEPITSKGVTNSTSMVNNIIAETKNASTNSQLTKMGSQRIFSDNPIETAVDAANTVAKKFTDAASALYKDLSAVLVPGNEPLRIGNTAATIPATVGGTGISLKSTGGGINSINRKPVSHRASIAIDANLAVLPTNNILSDKSLAIAAPSIGSETAITNKLAQASSLVTNKAQDIISAFTNEVENAADKIKNYINTNPLVQQINPSAAKTTVVPVSKDMSVLTGLPKEKASEIVPVPQYEKTPVSQQTTVRRFENKINGPNQDTTISISKSQRAAETVRNGNYAKLRSQNNLPSQKQDNYTKIRSQTNKISSDISATNNQSGMKSAVRLPTQEYSVISNNKYTKPAENLGLSDLFENQVNTIKREISQQTVPGSLSYTTKQYRGLY